MGAGARLVLDGGMLARMNFASTLASTRSSTWRATRSGRHPDACSSCWIGFHRPSDSIGGAQATGSITRRGTWTGNDAQLQQRPGLAQLIVGSGEYQLI